MNGFFFSSRNPMHQSLAIRSVRFPIAWGMILLMCLFRATSVSAQTSPATLPDLKLSTAGAVNAVVGQSDGKIIIGGYFFSVNEVSRTNLARLNPNGSVDLTWNPPAPNADVSSMALDGTNLFIGGTFTQVGGVSKRGIAKIGTADSGALDTNWTPVLGSFGETYALGVSGSQLYVGGSFRQIGGLDRTNLARVSTAGSGPVDATWNPNPNNIINAIAFNGTNVFVAGRFTNIGGLGRVFLAKLSSSGSGAADSAWNAAIPANPASFSGDVRAMAIDQTNLFAGGFYTDSNNITRTLLAKYALSNGQMVTSWNPTTDGFVHALAATNGSVYVGGAFFQVGGSNFNGFAKVSSGGAGAVDPNWRQDDQTSPAAINTDVRTLLVTGAGVFAGGAFKINDGQVSLGIAKADLVTGKRDSQFGAQVQVPGFVYALAQQADGKIILGGDFWFAGGLPRKNLARMNADGTLDNTWIPGADGQINALAITASNVFIGGNFAQVNGTNRSNLAKLAILASDAVDTNWNAGTVSGGNGKVSALVISGTNLFVGGGFTIVGGQTRQGLAKLVTTGTGALDTNWVANVTGMTVGVESLALDGTNIFVGGAFTGVEGLSRTGLAKVTTTGSGVVDASWQANFVNNGEEATALTASSTNLFVGGRFYQIGGVFRTNLAKVSTITAQVDPSWNPMTNLSRRADAIVLSFAPTDNGTNIFIGGNIFYDNGTMPTNTPKYVVKVSVASGAVDYTFNRGLDGLVYSLLLRGKGVYAGGYFSKASGLDRQSLVFLPVVGAPQLLQDNATDFFVARNAADGGEVTHFRFNAISGGTLYRSDGVTPVNVGDFITVAEGDAGLKFVSGGSVTVVSAINNTPNGAGSASSVLTMVTNPIPIFKFSAASYSVREGQGSVIVTVRKFGNGAATVNYATSDITTAADLDYQSRSGTLNFSATDKLKNIIITVADDLLAEGNELFAATLTNASAGSSIAPPAVATVTISDNDVLGLSDSVTSTVLPASPPVSTAVLQVSLQPTNASGQWRLLGELNWHDSGASVSGLVSGNYGIEFRPVNGFFQPPTVTLPISAGVTNQSLFFYAAITNLDTGNLSVVIQPDDIASAVNTNSRGQWRRVGEATWRDSRDVVPNLSAGTYTVEFKAVSGRIAPPPQLVQVGGGNANYSTIGTYFFGSSPGAQTPVVVPFGTATTNSPYLYNGQLQTDIGFGSGFVVKQRVVLTAAHVLFDDVLLSYVTGARWFFQRYRDKLEPVPQTPRGWYVFDGYAAQREQDDSPGISTPASQNLDAAAIYFLEDAGRGGYGGYLASDADNNEFLLSANNKFLAGYPLDGIADADKGKLHATTPANLNFTRLYTGVFATTNIASFPGNSGGPIYVQADVNQYLPAAIFLGGSGETVVRAINGEVVDLIQRAEVSGNGGGNSTGGGVIIVSPGQTAAPFGTGLLTVNLTPSNAGNTRPGWRITGLTDTNYLTDPLMTVALLAGGSYPVEFKPIPGFIPPSNRTVSIALGGQVTIQGDYVGIRPQLGLNRTNGLMLSGGSIGATYRVEFATNFPQAVWSSLTSFTLINSSFPLSNTVPPTNGNRFYRAVLVP